MVLNENQIDIIRLNENRLDGTIKDQEIHMDGYQIFRNDANIDDGGVAFYVKDSLTDVKVKLISAELELLCLEITTRNAKSMLLLSWYRPPIADTDKTDFDSLREMLRQLDKEGKELILCS